MLIDSSSSINNDKSEADGFSFDGNDDTDEVIGQDCHVKFVYEYQSVQVRLQAVSIIMQRGNGDGAMFILVDVLCQ